MAPAGFPGAGDNTYTNTGFVNKYIKVWRNGLLQAENAIPGININVDSSLGILLYDNFEGRVTRRFDIPGIESSWSNGSVVTQGDLSPLSGLQTGIYRIFLVPEPAEPIVAAEEVTQLFRLNPTPSAP